MSVNGVEDERKVVEAGNPGNVVTDNLTMNRIEQFYSSVLINFAFIRRGSN